jgi:hypothetical protein
MCELGLDERRLAGGPKGEETPGLFGAGDDVADGGLLLCVFSAMIFYDERM